MKKLKLSLLVACGLMLSGCVSTQTISGISTLGYERFANFNGAEAYACPKPKCGADNVIVVHKSSPLSGKDKVEFDNLVDPAKASEAKRSLNSLFAASNNRDVKIGKPKQITISGRTAYSFSITGKGKEPDGAIIIMRDGNKAQYFAGLSTKKADGTRGAITLARQWAKTQR